MKTIIFGEVIWDVYPDKKTIGGAPFNFGANISLLGDEAFLVTAVGNDELGENALKEMKHYGIKTVLVSKSTYPTGRCTVTLDENKIPSYFVHENTAYDNITITDETIEKIKAINADVFYFNTLIQRNETSRNSLKKILSECSFKEVFCDINIREGCYSKESILLCMERATMVKISDEELHYLYDTQVIPEDATTLAHICTIFPNIKMLLFTEGEKGSRVYDATENKTYFSKKVPNVEVVSTVGAGDSYGAAFINSIYQGDTIDTAINKASKLSAKVVAGCEAIIR